MPGPRVVWGALAAAGGAYELYALLNSRDGDTLSEVTRDVFKTHTPAGKVLFAGAWTGLTVWFVPHIVAYAVEAAEEALEAPPCRWRRAAQRFWWPTA